MTSSSIDLSGKIPHKILGDLRTVYLLAESMGMAVFVIGATARDIVMEHMYGIRAPVATADIDFGVMVESWDRFEELRKRLMDREDFEEVNKTFKFRNRATGVPIDLVPFGGLEHPAGTVPLEAEGTSLTTAGFDVALRSSIEVRADDGFKFKVASIPGLVLLKLVAYHDRPLERDRDVQDVWLILRKFLDIGNEDRLYNEHADLLDDPDFDLERAAARMLGRDVGRLLTSDTRAIVLDTLSEGNPHGGMDRMVTIVEDMENRLDDIADRFASILSSFKLGLTEPEY